MAGFGSRFALFQRISASLRASTDRSVSFKGLSPEAIVLQLGEVCRASLGSNSSTLRDRSGQRLGIMNLPFRLFVEPSTIPNAGFGVFLGPSSVTGNTKIKQGALYPGLVYSSVDPIFFPSINNHYVLQRIDGSLIDGKHTEHCRKREKAWNGIEYDNRWIQLRRKGECFNWSIGQLINNSSNSLENANGNKRPKNSLFTLSPSFPIEWRQYIPNVPYSPEEAEIHGIALVTTKDLVFHSIHDRVELLASYQSF
ncbi:hypothetical protein BDR26DRAFT_870867 [Obelidium mucronatum]|nr:hypothetical protein BDR26DRAFT_870867 [Obelidium mucronatum]